MPVERPLSEAENDELNACFTLALGFLPVDQQTEPSFLIAALHLLLEEARAGRFQQVPLDDLATYAGVLWGDELCRMSGWEWCYLTFPDGLEGAAVVRPDRSQVVLPVHLVYRWITRPNQPNSCQPLFVQLSQEEPPAAPYSYTLTG